MVLTIQLVVIEVVILSTPIIQLPLVSLLKLVMNIVMFFHPCWLLKTLAHTAWEATCIPNDLVTIVLHYRAVFEYRTGKRNLKHRELVATK